jgi:hypothetical protein
MENLSRDLSRDPFPLQISMKNMDWLVRAQIQGRGSQRRR